MSIDTTNTGTFTEYPALEDLPGLIQKQRRLTAGQLRISREESALRDEIRRLLDAAGVELVTVNGYEVRRCHGRDGRDTSRVSPVRANG
jgi:hypothetical protein